MTDNAHSSPEKLRQIFEQQRTSFKEDPSTPRAMEAVRILSRMINGIRQAHIEDIDLVIHDYPGSFAFKLFKDYSTVTVPITGIISIGPSQHMIAICTHEKKKDREIDRLLIALSYFDPRFDDGKDGRALVVDIYNDPNAIYKLENDILRYAARRSVIDENDVENAFSGGNQLKKTVPRPFQK